MADIEQTHFLRAFLLLVEGGTFIARAILLRERNKSGRDLESLLSDFKTKLKHEFHGKQYQKLFPDTGVNTDINTWDLQLLIGVVSIIFRKTISKSEKKDLRLLKQLRNEVFMHCANVSLDEDEYDEVIEQLEDALNGLATTFDNNTKDACFTYIKTFKCGPLDAVRPSIATINGLSQTGQQTFKVGLSTVLAVDGPSDDWKDVCENIIVTVLNNVITGSEGEDFPNVKNKVIKLLDFLSANKDIALKEYRKACIVLEFECGSYDDMLHLLNLFDSWKYRYYLNKIANSLTKELELNCLLTLSTRVATESLQSILIHYIKMLHEEETTDDCIEIASDANINDSNEGNTQLRQRSDDTVCLNDDIRNPLKLDMECKSQEGLLHILNAFKGNQLQVHLKDVADALSEHTKQKITLKTSLNIKDFMSAFEETVIAKRRVDRMFLENIISEPRVTSAETQQRSNEAEPEIEEEIIEATQHENTQQSAAIQTDKKEYTLLFRGIHPDTCRGALAGIIQETTHGVAEYENIIFNHTRTCAVVKLFLTQRPDLDLIRDTLRQKCNDDERPDVHDIPPADSIAVSTEEGIGNIECLEYYFESRKVCGYELKQAPYKSEDESCVILQFGDPEVVKNVCSRSSPFIWEGMELRVSPCYIFEDVVIWDTETHYLSIPKSFTIELDRNITTLLQRKCCEQLSAELKSNNCVSKITGKGIELSCSLTPSVIGFRRLSNEWKETSEHIVDRFIKNNITETSFKTSESVWNDFMLYFKSENLEGCEELVCSVDETRFEVFILGLRQTVDKLCAKLEEKHSELRQETEIVVFEAPKIQLMRACGVFEEMKLEMGEMKIHIKDGETDIVIRSSPEDLVQVKLGLYEVTNKIVKRKQKHDFTKACVEFIEGKLKDELTSHLKSRYTSNFVEWEIDNRDINVYTFDEVKPAMSGERFKVLSEHNYAEDTCTTPEDILNASILEIQEIVPVTFDKRKLETFLKEINNTYHDHVEVQYIESQGILAIYGMKEEVKVVHSKVKEFLYSIPVQIVERVIEQDVGYLQFLQKYKKEFVRSLEKAYSVNIDIQDKRVIVTGCEDGVLKAERELNVIFEEIICEKVIIQKVGVKVALRDDEKQMQLSLEGTNQRCIIQFPDEHATRLASGASNIDSSDEFKGSVLCPSKTKQDQEFSGEIPYEKDDIFETANGISVMLVKGELGEQEGDIIVAGTSHNLNLKSGNACKSLGLKAGEKLQEACNKMYPKGIQSDEVAEIKGCGNLACKYVYLTSLPSWTSGEETKEGFKMIMKKSLERASDKKMKSIVFSALGTGQLNYPKDLVAFLMYDAVVTFDRCHPQTTLKDVRFVLYPKDGSTIKAFEEEERMRKENRGRNQHIFDLKAAALTIQVCVDDITAQNVDAIFSSSSSNMDRRHNAVLDTLFDKGGELLRDECKSKYNWQIGMDDIAEIRVGNLPCKTVYMASIKGDTDYHSKEHLKEVVRKVLFQAVINGFVSLAIPALLKGDNGYEFKEDVCTILFDTVIEWAKENPESALKTVKFVIDPKDGGTINRFKAYVLNAKGIGRRSFRSSLDEHHEFSSEPGLSEGKVLVRVQMGDILEQKTDAIVTSVGKDFHLIGSVAYAMKTKCPDLEKQCRSEALKHKLNMEKVVITEAKGLQARSVIHIQFADNFKDWQYRMRKCLELANEKSYSSISFPVLGTGRGFKTFCAKEITRCLIKAVKEFEQSHPSPSLRNVYLIVYDKQPQLHSQIIDALQAFTQESKSETTTGEQQISSRLKSLRQFASADNDSGEEMCDMSAKQWKTVVEETSSVEIRVYSDERDNIKLCRKMLETNIDQMYIERKLDNYKKIVQSLHREQIGEIDMIALADITIDQASGIISIYGPREDVLDVTQEIRKKLLQMNDTKPDLDAAEKLAHLVQWQYEEVTLTGFNIVPYKKLLNYRIEQAYRANLQCFMFEENGECFLVDFQHFVEYRKSDATDRIRVMRKDVIEVPKDLAATEEQWMEWTCEEIEDSFLSGEGSYEYRNIFEMKDISVIKVERIRPHKIYQQYQEQRRQIVEQKSKSRAVSDVERDLWYAVSHDELSDIVLHGFNTSYCGRVSPLYGEGVYFTSDASYSIRRWLSTAGSGGKGYMFLSKVLTGNMCQGQKGTRFLTEAGILNLTHQYDSAVDNLTDPKEFIVFKDTQMCPRYLITFQYKGT